MVYDIALIHRYSNQEFEILSLPSLAAARANSELFLWQTCLRSLVFASPEHLRDLPLQAGDTYLEGLEAYQFCLEIICGLKSPIVGETEVLGQFKRDLLGCTLPMSPFGVAFGKFLRDLMTDSKLVRLSLSDLGAQSYGSFLRKELAHIEYVQMIGAGALAQEILPWILKSKKIVQIFARNPDKARHDLAKRFAKTPEILQWDCTTKNLADARMYALVVVAPISDQELKAWLQTQPGCTHLIDLRAQSGEGFKFISVYYSLKHVMDSVNANQLLVREKKLRAESKLSELVADRSRRMENRPFGWDDLCA